MENEFRKHQILKARQEAQTHVYSENMVAVGFCELMSNLQQKEDIRLFIISSDLEKDAL